MFSFIREFIKHPRRIGAIAPSGKALAEKMMLPIDFQGAKCIVEYGPGTGAFTREIIKRKKDDTLVLLMEQNPAFCHKLRKAYGKVPNVVVIEGSAAQVKECLTQYGQAFADYIVSGLPFTSLPSDLSESILRATKKAIGTKGLFVTFQYSLVKQGFFERHFRIVNTIRELRNLPPAYVLVMKA